MQNSFPELGSEPIYALLADSRGCSQAPPFSCKLCTLGSGCIATLSFRSKIVLRLSKSRNVQSAFVILCKPIDSDMIWLFGVFLVPCLHTVKGIKLRMDLTQLDKLSLALQSDILDDSLGGYLHEYINITKTSC